MRGLGPAAVLALLLASPTASDADCVTDPRARELARRGLYREAAERYREAAGPPAGPEALRDRMWTFRRAGDLEGTIESAACLLERLPRDREALELLALAQSEAGRHREALRAYLALESLSSPAEHVSRTLAALFERFKDYPSALARSERLAAVHPDDAALHAQRGRLLFLLGRYEDSCAAFREALDLSGDPAHRVSLARALHFSGRRDESLRELKAVLASDPRRKSALELYVQEAVVDGRRGDAERALERAVRGPESPEQETFLLALSELYDAHGLKYKALGAAERALERNPASGPALRAEADLLMEGGRYGEGVRALERLVRLNGGSATIWAALSEALYMSGRSDGALYAMDRARALDPADPFKRFTHARLLLEAGREPEGRALLEGWLRPEGHDSVAILTYHGVTARPDDPSLASPVHVTAAAFRSHMEALRGAGYTAVTVAEVSAWLRGGGSLPPRPVLITFDDARLDSFVNADPILKQYGMKAAMFAPMVNVESYLPGFAGWEDLERFQATGRWEIQAHGDRGHAPVRIDAEGRQGRFFTHLRWLEDRRRQETVQEWEERVRGDHEATKRKLLERLKALPTAFAFPEGDYGQLSSQSVPDAAERNLRLCRESYAICFAQNPRGVNARFTDPAQLGRLEPRGDWSGARLVQYIRDQDPAVHARRGEIRRLVWDKRALEAMRHLEANARAGVSRSSLLADEARIRAADGDLPRGLALARQAFEEERTPETRQLVEDLDRQAGPVWSPEPAYYEDNRDRRNLVFRQTLGPFPAGAGALSFSHLRALYREGGTPDVTADGGGLELRRGLGLGQDASVRWEARRLGAGAGSAQTLLGVLSSRWTPAWRSELRAGQQPLETAAALRAGVRERLVSLGGVSGEDDSWQASARLRLASLSDDNSRWTLSAGVSRPVGPWKGLRAVYQFTADDVRRQSPYYYSPSRLTLHQAGLAWSGSPWPWLSAGVKLLPGYGKEEGAPGRFSHTVELGAVLRKDRLSLQPAFSMTRSPLYRAATFSAAFGYRF